MIIKVGNRGIFINEVSFIGLEVIVDYIFLFKNLEIITPSF